MKFKKMQGAGNDFLLFDGINNKYENYSEMAKKLCDRRFGVGGDGIMIAEASACADIQMVYYNSDGSRGEMCGNGIRCFSKFIYEEGLIKDKIINIETGDGIKTSKLKVLGSEVLEVTISMGRGRMDPSLVPVLTNKKEALEDDLIIDGNKIIYSSVLVGVPHTVIVCKELEKIDINRIGSVIEKHQNFPRNTNVNFIQILDRNNIKIKTWERGAGRTLACGTGSCASVYIGNRLNLLENDVVVETEGGILKIKLLNDEIFMTGGAETTFEGDVKWGL
ncbi:diaminopimelate epimerase [uncultured Cetobacterium sp.]|uniref:diaminopimelate epimerase n=1 Tax=uncultured Cetobacterium sp. TaxID=527638 RepID=UPI002608A22A|nr:diaminopimelate epimerase [uncultured Cetobacterium sp.]